MTKRNQEKNTIRDRAFNLMQKSPNLCGDNTHKLVTVMFEEEFGAELTEEHIKFIVSVGRARRMVLKNNPDMDKRNVTVNELEPEDRKYYGENDHVEQGETSV